MRSTAPATATVEPSPSPTTAPPTPTAAAPTPTTPLATWGNGEIYVMAADGSDQRRITETPDYDGSPAFSPDGRWIVFSSARDGGAGLYVMRADGSEARPLTPPGYGGRDAAWSPDGARVAYTSERDGHSEIYVINADGTDVARLTSSEIGSTSPSWSPDGSRIAFATYMDNGGNSDMFVANSDGTNLTRLTDTPAEDYAPAWSPDGGRIAFVSASFTDGTVGLDVIAPDGANRARLAEVSGSVDAPAWSPDGSRIAFSRDSGRGSDIFLLAVASGEIVRLTDAPHDDSEPNWSPDGTQLVFSSNRDGGQPLECSWAMSQAIQGIPSLAQLSWMADGIVVGEIVEALPAAFGAVLNPSREQAPTIYTDYLLRVDTQLKGAPAETLRVRTVGGTVGACVQTAEGEPRLTTGARLLLFVAEGGPSGELPPAAFILGGGQGYWPIGADGRVTNGGYPESGLTEGDIVAAVRAALASGPPSDMYPGDIVPIEGTPPATATPSS